MNNIPSDIITVETPAPKKADKPPVLLAPRLGRQSFWKSVFGQWRYLGLCFLVPALIMWLIYICLQTFPFGEESVLVLDLNGQYVYFFEGLRDILLGESSPIYSFSRALGGEFFGIFAYYLASPFSFLVLLFPKSMITEALLLMFLLKAGSCGLTFGIYIEATRKRSRVATVMFSCMYALCAYAVVMQHNTMWIDNMILLPLVMLGIENLIKYGKFKLYVISLTLAIFSNFYIGYMMCIFSAVYFFYAYFSRDPEERNPLGMRHHFAKSAGRFALFSIIAAVICAALLLCTYYSLSFGKTEFSNPNYAFNQKFDWMDLVSKLFIGSYDTVRPEGLPFVYCGILTLILLPLYFFAPHIKTREKVASSLLIAFFLLSFNITTLDLFWHGMQRPNWLNYRYSFMLCFIMVLLAYKAFERIREIGYRKVLAVCGTLALILIILQKLEYEHVDDLATIWLSLLIIGVYMLILRASTHPRAYMRSTASLVLAILVGVELFGAGIANLIDLDEDVVYSSRTSYRSFIDRFLPVVEEVQRQDESFYRMEKTLHRKTNDPYALHMYGLSNSTSTLNQETIKLLNNLGLASKSHWTKYLGSTPVVDSLLGIKYLIAEAGDDSVPAFYEAVYTSQNEDTGSDDLTAYENPYALSLAFAVNKSLETLNINDASYASPFERLNAIVDSMLGDDAEGPMFKAQSFTEEASPSLTASTVSGHTKYTKNGKSSESSVTYTLNITSSDTLYCYFPSNYAREADLYVNGVKKGTFFGNETFRVVELGAFNPGDQVTVSLTLLEDELYIKQGENYFYYMNTEALEKAMPLLGENQYQIESYREDSFTGTITVTENKNLVFTSIPYDEGWNIYANGEKITPVKLLDGVIGFYLDPGEYTLELKYWPSCLSIGLIGSVVGLCAFAAAWVLSEQYRKRKLAAGYPVYVPCDPNAEVCTDETEVPQAEAFQQIQLEMEENTPTLPEDKEEQA